MDVWVLECEIGPSYERFRKVLGVYATKEAAITGARTDAHPHTLTHWTRFRYKDAIYEEDWRAKAIEDPPDPERRRSDTQDYRATRYKVHD